MPATDAPKSLCLVRLSALGDVVMALALVRHLQACLPATRITWVCGKPAFPLISELAREGIDLVAIDKPRGPSDWLALRRRLPVEPFDVLLAAQASWRANLLYPFIKARRKIGFSRDRAKDGHRWFIREAVAPAKPHLVDGFLQFAEALGLPWPAAVEFRLPVSGKALESVLPRLPSKPFLAVNLCSSKAERDWPLESYAETLRRAGAGQRFGVVFIGGPSPRERARVDALLPEIKGESVDLVGRTSIPEMVAVLSRCAAVLSPDTGAVHIARALERPVVGLYAVAPTSRTGPYQRTEYCVDRFDDAARRLLGREPSTLPWSARVHVSGAMSLISVDEVIEKLERCLARESPPANPGRSS